MAATFLFSADLPKSGEGETPHLRNQRSVVRFPKFFQGLAAALLLLSVLSAGLTPGIAKAGAPIQGFATLNQFVSALRSMPAEQFAKKGKLTSATHLHDWCAILSQSTEVDPSELDAWNEKLRLIPGPGFGTSTDAWVIHLPPKSEVQPFGSIDDLYRSVLSDSPEFFQSRANVTVSSDLQEWYSALLKENPSLGNVFNFKIYGIRSAGFGTNDYKMPGSNGASAGIGFKPVATEAFEPFKTYVSFIEAIKSAGPREFRSQLALTSRVTVSSFVHKMKTANPDLMERYAQLLSTRGGVGYGAAEMVPNSAPKAKSVLGFAHGTDCNGWLKAD